MEDKYIKYPKTFHFAWSKPNPHGNDRVHDNVDHFVGKEVVVTEKLDGENTSMYFEKIHARSIDSAYHPSRTWVKAFHASIAKQIPPNYRVCGENMQAKHAIFYDGLPSYFFAFGVYNNQNLCLSWDDTIEFAIALGLQTVPVLYRGVWDKEKVHACFTGKSVFGNSEQEGYVVRTAAKFEYDNFTYSVNKFVRPGHVAGDSEHWSKTGYKPNKMVK
jgi:hypothetical protein